MVPPRETGIQLHLSPAAFDTRGGKNGERERDKNDNNEKDKSKEVNNERTV